MGIFAGSGVGKSTLMSMIARGTDADVLVIGLIGERGRELDEFLHRTLGAEGRARSVVVAATSDMSAMMRRRAAYVTLTIAECLRDQGLRVLCLMDSVTRFAMALREIYLAAGEVPTSRGYPPCVFAELPRLLERAGPGEGEGSHHRPVHRPGRGRRHQRAGQRRGSRHPGRAHRAGPRRSPRAGAFPADRRAAQPLAHRSRLLRARRAGSWCARRGG